jgi:hypothetical protein
MPRCAGRPWPTTWPLGRALLDQDRAAHAETAFRQTLALVTQDGDASLAQIVSADLARALRAREQGSDLDPPTL